MASRGDGRVTRKLGRAAPPPKGKAATRHLSVGQTTSSRKSSGRTTVATHSSGITSKLHREAQGVGQPPVGARLPRRGARHLVAAASRDERRSKREITFGTFQPRAIDGQFSILELHAITSTTEDLYNAWFKELQDFATSIDRTLDTVKSADAVMTDFADYLFLEGFEKADLLKAYAAAAWHLADLSPWGKLRLPRFQRAIKGYTNLDPGVTMPPIPWEIACLIARQLAEAMKSEVACLAVLLMFTAYLRPIDLHSLKEEDLCPPSASSHWWALNLHPAERGDKSKIGLCDESILLDTVYLPGLGESLAKLKTGNPVRKLFNVEPPTLLWAWKGAMRQLGFPADAIYVQYQLRHGGPSHDRLVKCRALPEIQRRGRWLAEGTVRRYEASARLQQEWARFPAALQLKAREAVAWIQTRVSSQSLGNVKGPARRATSSTSTPAPRASAKRLRAGASTAPPGTRSSVKKPTSRTRRK